MRKNKQDIIDAVVMAQEQARLADEELTSTLEALAQTLIDSGADDGWLSVAAATARGKDDLESMAVRRLNLVCTRLQSEAAMRRMGYM